LTGDARAVIAVRRGETTLGDAIASGAIAARGSKRALRHEHAIARELGSTGAQPRLPVRGCRAGDRSSGRRRRLRIALLDQSLVNLAQPITDGIAGDRRRERKHGAAKFLDWLRHRILLSNRLRGTRIPRTPSHFR